MKAFRREQQNLKAIILQDSTAANDPHIKLLRARGLRFILRASKGSHGYLFDRLRQFAENRTLERQEIEGGKAIFHRFRWLNDAPLNGSNDDLRVNFLEYAEIRPNGRTTKFSWVTDLPLEANSVMQVMRAGRCRWRIDSATIKTLKFHGQDLEHNDGHGIRNLSSVFASLAILAFPINLVQEDCCSQFQQALRRKERKLYLWDEMRGLFVTFGISEWTTFFRAIGAPMKSIHLGPNDFD